MKKHTKNDPPPKNAGSGKKRSPSEDAQLEAKKAAKSIDTANRDAGKDDRKSGM
jgi:hypothetical protein